MDNFNPVINVSKSKTDSDILQKILNQVQTNINYGDIIWDGSKPNSKKERDLVFQIETQLVKNNIEYSEFPTDYTHGLLCKYLNRKSPKIGEKFILMNNIWNTIDVFPTSNLNQIYASLYADHTHKHLVLVFRTNDCNFDSFLDDSTNSNEVNLCQRITKSVIEILKYKFKDYNISFTGYLNGAWSAEFCNYYLNEYYNISNKKKAVLFDGPGIIRPNKTIAQELILVMKKDSNIVNYLTTPNIFNSFNKHEGKSFKIDIKETPASEISEMLTQLANDTDHHLADIQKKVKYSRFFYDGMCAISNNKRLELILDEFDSTTGKPFACKEALKWPSFHFTVEKLSPVIQIKPTKTKLLANIKKKLSKESPVSLSSPIEIKLSECDLKPSPLILIEILDGLTLKGIDFNCFNLENLNSNHTISFEATVNSSHIKCEFQPGYALSSYSCFRQELKSSTLELLQQIDLNDFKIANFKTNVFIGLLDLIKSSYKIVQSNDKSVKLIESNYYTIDFVHEKLKRVNYLDSNFEKLILNSNLSMSTKISDIGSNLPIYEDEFVGRDLIFKKIMKSFQTNNTAIICGDSGTGKSRLAFEIGSYLMRDHLVRVINSEAVEELEIDYCEFAHKLLKMDSRSIEIDYLIKLVNHKLSEYVSNVLIIFDNVEDYSVIEKFLRNLPSSKVKVIITTKFKNLIRDSDSQVQTEILDSFDSDEAKEYFDKNLNFNLIDEIPAYLQLPIEFYLAKHYINFNNVTSKVFDEIYSEASIFKVLFKRLKKESEETFNMLTYCSLLDADAISFNLLRKLIDDKNLSTNIIRLKNYGLISINYEKSYVTMHRLVQKEFIKFSNIDYLHVIEHISTQLFLIIKNDIQLDQHREFDYFHLRKILELAEHKHVTLNRRHLVIFQRQLANFNFHFRHNYKDALNDYKNFYSAIDVDPDATPEELSSCLHHLALCYMKTNKHFYALDNHLKAIEFRELICERDPFQSEILAESYESLGLTYFEIEKYQEAFNYFTKSLEIRDKFHLDKSNSLHGLGRCHAKRGDYQKAIDSFYEAYNLKKGDNSNLLAKIAYDIGCAYDKLSKYEKAFEFYLESYEIRKRIFQFDHVDLVESVYGLATSYDKLADYNLALKHHKEAYFMRKNLFNVPPSQTTSSLASVFDMLRKVGMNLAKLDKQTESDILDLKDLAKFMNENKHSLLAQSLNAIGLVYSSLQQDEQALQYAEIAYNIRRSLFKEPHLELADSLNSLAVIIGKSLDRKKMQESIDFKLKATEMLKKLNV